MKQKLWHKSARGKKVFFVLNGRIINNKTEWINWLFTQQIQPFPMKFIILPNSHINSSTWQQIIFPIKAKRNTTLNIAQRAELFIEELLQYSHMKEQNSLFIWQILISANRIP